MPGQTKIFRELKKKFDLVHSNITENNTPESLRFLLDVIDTYKIDVSNIRLYSDEYNFLAYSHNLLSIRTKEFSASDARFAILHELRHLIQYQSGWLKRDALGIMMFWSFDKEKFEFNSDEKYSLSAQEYNYLPWEMDANKFALTSPMLGKLDPFSEITSGIAAIVRDKYPNI